MAKIMKWQMDWVGAVALICGLGVIVPSMFALSMTLIAVARMIF